MLTIIFIEENREVYNGKYMIHQVSDNNNDTEYKVDSLDELRDVLHADKDPAGNLDHVRQGPGEKHKIYLI